jgi:dTDP-4-amino-4,6-dideoxygalactose transaminase
VLTSDDRLAAVMRSLRVHGQGSHKYDNVRIGLAARLDTLQAAVLLEKLAIFDDEIERRNAVAARYTAGLSNACITPRIPDGARSVWAQYTIRVEAGRRQRIADVLKADGIPTHVYYPIPLHRQQAYRQFPIAGASLPVAERLAGEVLSLPMHPYLAPDVQDRIIAAARRALGAA